MVAGSFHVHLESAFGQGSVKSGMCMHGGTVPRGPGLERTERRRNNRKRSRRRDMRKVVCKDKRQNAVLSSRRKAKAPIE